MSTTLELQESCPQENKGFPPLLVAQLKRLEYGFTLIALFFYSNDIILLFLTGGASEGDGQDMFSFDYSLMRQLYLLIYFFTFIFVILRWKKILYTLGKNKYLFALLLLVPLSAIWSVDPAATISGSVAMVSTALMGVYLASRYTLQELLKMLGLIFGIGLVLNLIFVLCLPKYGIMGGVHQGAWRGIYVHKNAFGHAMAFASTLFFVLAKTQKPKWLYWTGFIATVVFILLSASSTALLSFAIVNAFTIGTRFFCLGKKRFLLFLVASILIGGALSVWLPEIFANTLGAVGKDTTLTGRTDLWPFAIDKIIERPWFGYGYSSFWQGLDGESAYIIRAVRWNAPNAHNGYLDLWLQLGFVGLAIYVAVLWEIFFKASLLIRLTHSWKHNWVIALLALSIISNFSETILMTRNYLGTILFISVGFSEAIEFRRFLRIRQQHNLQISHE